MDSTNLTRAVRQRAANRSRRAALYEWMLMMHGAYLTMSEQARDELRGWELVHVTGNGEYGTSDWPGWQRLGLPPKP